MRRKIVISLIVLLACSASGAAAAVVYITRTTDTLARLIELHQVEELRRNLINAVQTVQTDLYTAHTWLGQESETVAANVSTLRDSARACSGCHHEAGIAARLAEIDELLSRYEDALGAYVDAPPERERIGQLKLEAAALGSMLLERTEAMSLQASRSLEVATAGAMGRVRGARTILYVTVLATLVLAVAVAVHLSRSVTRPIERLVAATRAVAAGDLDFKVAIDEPTEFGELAAKFDAMSTALRDSRAAAERQLQERLEAEKALRQSEERYALAARGANDGLWDWDLAAGTIYLSSRWKSMLGHNDLDVAADPDEWFRRVHVGDRPRLDAAISAHLAGTTPHFECEYRIQHADGSYLSVVCRGLAVRDATGHAYRMAGSQTDITARRRAEERLQHDALHDALTGLPNRALFLDRLEHVIRATRRDGGQLYAVLFLDLDRFKVINDSLGHVIGDKLLVAASRRLAEIVRPTDTVARLGGDEFAILLPDVPGLADALQVAERVKDALSRSFEVEGHEIFAKGSIGVALRSDRYEHAEQVLRDADVAMYEAKGKSKNGCEVFDARMHGSIVERLGLEADLRRALEHADDDPFLVHYQPIVDLRTSRLLGFEALVRWRHPQRGLVPPSEFIPIAEESGMVGRIGSWVMRRACAQLRSWERTCPELAGASLSLNMSGRQFKQADVVDEVARILAETGIDPHRIALEVTETVIMEDVEVAAAKLERLQAMGIHIHVDDFGTGYSSLSYLHRFPIGAVKIDRSFITDLSDHGESEEVIRAIVSIAESLGFEVIAEGIEHPAQLAKLRELRCHHGQGYVFARPMAASEAEAWAAGRAGLAVAEAQALRAEAGT